VVPPQKIPSYAEASEGYPPPAKSAEATSFDTSRVEAQVTHSSTGRARGLLRRRINSIKINLLSKVAIAFFKHRFLTNELRVNIFILLC